MNPRTLAGTRARATLLNLLLAMVLVEGGLAADKNGVSPNAVSLPKGPGSIEGLGESFQPSLNSGQAQYSVSLRLPPGAGGHSPSLALRYEGGAGNGVLGPGWSLPIPMVQRRSDHGLPTYGEPMGFDRSDTFINEAREELIPREDGYFFCRNEGAFVRYEFKTDHWVGTRPDGARMEFGLSDASRITDGTHIFAWLLEKVTDLHGNVERYVYRGSPGTENRRQRYLVRIEYGAGAPPWTARQFVQFDYQDRPDPIEDARPGFVVATGRRLSAISVATQGVTLDRHLAGDFDDDGSPDFLNRRYTLEYLPEAAASPPVSLLTRVLMVGIDGVTPLPPLTLGYAVCHPPAWLDAFPGTVVSSNEPPAVMDNPLVEFIDLNGDGLPDVIKTESGGGAHVAYLNQGESTNASGRAVHWSSAQEVGAALGAAWNYHLGQNETHLADMNGDGLADLVHRTAGGDAFYFANRGDVGWGLRQALATSDAPPPAPFGQPDVRTGDFDFDKRIDIIQSVDNGGGHDYRVWFNLGSQTYSPPITVPQESGFSFSDSAVQIADLNGDRIPDIARIRPSAIEITLGLGYGRFDTLRVSVLPDGPLSDDQVRHAKLTDLNGDGLADLVIERAGPGECWYWLNGDHGQFSERRVIGNLPAFVGQNAVVRWADLNGNGSVDLVYADHESDQRLLGFDLASLFACAPAPNLMIGITNGLGRNTQITYDPSTRFLLEDIAKGTPWPDHVPFPVTVVSSVTTDDTLGHTYLTRFQYHNGYYDSVEKQFRGFARVEQIEVGDATAPTLVTTYDFDTGRDDESMKGKTHRKRMGTEDGKLFTDELTLWVTPSQTLFAAQDGREVHYAHPIGQHRDILELGVGSPRRIESESSYDSFGNRTRMAEYGVVEGDNRNAGGDERITVTGYVLNLEQWLIRLPRRIETQDGSGKAISRTELFYDDETFSGENGGLATLGNLTMERHWKNPAEPSAFVTSRRSKFDAFGNIVVELDPLASAPGGTVDPAKGHARLMEFDTAFHSEVVRERAYAGNGSTPLEVTADYDFGLGTLIASTDFNGHLSRFEFDPLGRLSAMIRPGEQTQFPGVEYEYHLGVSVSGSGLVSYVETHELDRTPGEFPADRLSHYRLSRQYTDGLGRSLMVRSEAEPKKGSAAPRVVVTGARVFNARQQTRSALQPFFSTRSGTILALLDYESIETPAWRGEFERAGSSFTTALATAPRSSMLYDAQLRVVAVSNPDGTQRRTEHEPLLMREFDENDADLASTHRGTPRVRIDDGLDRLVEVQESGRMSEEGLSDGSVQVRSTRYRYDANNQLISAIDPFGNERNYVYDGLRRRVRLQDPDRGTLVVDLDDASNILETLDAKGQHSVFTYDGLNRRLTEQRLDGRALPPWRGAEEAQAEVIYHYDIASPNLDQGDQSLATAQNVRGRVAWVQDRSGEEHSSFDSRGRVSWVVKRVPMDLRSDGELASFRTEFAYDSADRISSLTYADGDGVSYEHSARGLIETVSGAQKGSVLNALSYSPAGHLNELTYGNGCVSRYQYDDRLRISHIQLIPPPSVGGDPSPLMDLGYEFDPASNITGIGDGRKAQAVPAADARRNTQSFGYDDLNRLVVAKYSFQPDSTPKSEAVDGGEIEYRFDAIGNLLEQRASAAAVADSGAALNLGTLSYGGAAGRRSRVARQPGDAAGPHALTAVAQGGAGGAKVAVPYDANGNVTAIDSTALSWDFKDRMISAEDANTRADYVYDYADRRILKQVWTKLGGISTARVVLYIDQHFELRDGNQPVKYAWLGNNRMARATGDFKPGIRVQRAPLRVGWNSWVCEVTTQWTPGVGTVVPDRALVWNPNTQLFTPLLTGEPIARGSILWLHSSSAGLWSLVGLGGNSFDGHWSAGPDYVPVPESWTTSTGVPDGSSVWIFDAETQTWRTWSSGPDGLSSLTDSKPTWRHGQAAYIRWPQPVTWDVPSASDAVLYYHADHLGSASLMTDAAGRVVEEKSYYPFGMERHHALKRGKRDSYGFSQKETDPETGLSYFESRYLSSAWARFLTTDPLITTVKADWLSDPQNANPYAYCKNRPMTFTDPDGMDPIAVGGGVKIDPTAPSVSFAKGPVSASADTGTVKAAYNFGYYKADVLFNYNLSAGAGLMTKDGGLRITADFKSGTIGISPSTPWLNMNFGYNPKTQVFSAGASGKYDKLSLSLNVATDKSFSGSVSYGAPLAPFALSDSFHTSIIDAEGSGRNLAGFAANFHGSPIDYYSANKDAIMGDVGKLKTGVDNVKKATEPTKFGIGFQIQGSSSTGVSTILGGQASF